MIEGVVAFENAVGGTMHERLDLKRPAKGIRNRKYINSEYMPILKGTGGATAENRISAKLFRLFGFRGEAAWRGA
jgi:hypothetical protein